VGEGGAKLRLFGLSEIPKISTICPRPHEYRRICEREATKMQLKHARASLGQQDALLDMNAAGARGLTSAVDLSGESGRVKWTQLRRESSQKV
jgi:hypothetical protein